MDKTNWKLSETHSQLAKKVRDDLDEVMDPELGMSVIQLGLIRDIEIKDAQANVTMIFTSPFCPYASRLLEACKDKVEESLNMPTRISVGKEVWDRTFMEEEDLDWGLY